MVDFIMMMLCLIGMAVVGSIFLFVVFMVGTLISCLVHEYVDRK